MTLPAERAWQELPKQDGNAEESCLGVQSMRSFLSWALIALGLLVAGCGGGQTSSGSATADPLVPPSEPPAAQVEGFLVRINPFLLVSQLSQAPAGARPVPNAMVTARGWDGRLLGMSLTGPDGRFRLENLGGGLVMLEGWSDPSQSQPDVRLPMTAVPGTSVRPNVSMPITREQAIERVRPQFLDTDLIACSLNPLPAGTVVRSDGTAPFRRQLAADEWLLFLNHNPDLFFEHDATVVFVNARTGELATFETKSFPVVNGAPMWGNALQLVEFPSGRLLPEAVQVPQYLIDGTQPVVTGLRSIEQLLERHNTTPDSVFVVMLSLASDGSGETSVKNFNAFLDKNDVPRANRQTVSSRAFLGGTLRELREEGIEVDQDKLRNDLKAMAKAAFQAVKAQIQARFERGEHSTLICYIATHGSGNGNIQIAAIYNFSPDELLEIGLLDNRACRVRLVVEACFSELFIRRLKTLIDANPIGHEIQLYAAAAADRASRFGFNVGGQFTNLLIQLGTIALGDLAQLQTVDPATGKLVLKPEFEELTYVGEKTKKTFIQGPRLLRIPGRADFCPESPPTTPPVTQPDPPARSAMEVQNRTDDRVSFRMVSGNQIVNDNLAVTLKPGGGFRQQFLGPVTEWSTQDFQDPGARPITELKIADEIQVNTRVSVIWEKTSGSRTLKLAQSAMTTPPPPPPAPPPPPPPATPPPPPVPPASEVCSRATYRNISSVTKSVRFTAGGAPLGPAVAVNNFCHHS